MNVKADSINVKRVLDKVIQDRLKTYTKDDFHRDLRQTSYPRIEEAVNYLRKEKIFIKARMSGALPKETDENAKRMAQFELSHSLTAFKKIFRIYLDSNEVDKLFNSEYTRRILYKHPYVKVHEKVMKHHLEKSNFQQISSRILLNHSAVKGEYEEVAKQLKIDMLETFKNMENIVKQPTLNNKIYLIDKLRETSDELSTNYIEHIDILSNYNTLMAVRLYRKTLHKSIKEAYDELAANGVISEGLQRFLVFDNYLSPFTAYPVNGTLRVLFSRPFERIYEDAYLLDGERFKLLSSRPAAIYCDFADFIFMMIKTDKASEEDLNTITERMIYHWNVASTRFDIICILLKGLYKQKAGSGNYHLKSDGLEFNIIDIKKGKKLLPADIAKSVLMVGSSPSIFKHSSDDEICMTDMKNPFTCLRPCLSFGDLGWKLDCVPIDEILSQLKLKFAEHNGGST